MGLTRDSEKMKGTAPILTEVANIAMEVQLMQAFIDTKSRDRVWLRTQCVAVQKELAKWKASPMHMDATIRGKCRLALELQAV